MSINKFILGSGLSPTQISASLIIAKDARHNYDKIKTLYHGHCHWICNDKTDTQAFAFYDKYGTLFSRPSLIFSYRGSQQLKDWFYDFNAFHLVLPYGNNNSAIKTHKGFTTCYKSIRDRVNQIVHSSLVDDPNINIIHIGHSLGGALATLGHVDTQYNFSSMCDGKIMSMCSGNPRVGNKEFSISFNKRCPLSLRTYCVTDWVPNFPPAWFGDLFHGGYYHCGNPNPIGSTDILAGFKLWLKTRGRFPQLAENITNHSIETYYNDFCYKEGIV